MKKIIGSKAVIFCIFVALVCVAFSILASQRANVVHEDLNRERYLRMVAEEKLEKERTRIRQLEAQNERNQKNMKSLEVLIKNDQEVIDQLKRNLEEVTRSNEALRQELESALARPVTD